MSLEKFIVYLLICFFLSFFIGIERQYRHRSVGLRTTILVAIGSYLFASFSFLLNGYNIDVTRIAAQIVTGIGFLGAGVILKDGVKIRGLTTAATLWCTASIGVLCASGFILEAISGTVIILFSNVFLRYVNKIVNQKSRYEQTSEEFKVTITSSKDRIKELIKDITSNTKFNINKLDVKKNTIILNITFFKSEEKQITEFIDIINKKYEIEEYSYEKLKEEIKIEEYDEL